MAMEPANGVGHDTLPRHDAERTVPIYGMNYRPAPTAPYCCGQAQGTAPCSWAKAKAPHRVVARLDALAVRRSHDGVEITGPAANILVAISSHNK